MFGESIRLETDSFARSVFILVSNQVTIKLRCILPPIIIFIPGWYKVFPQIEYRTKLIHFNRQNVLFFLGPVIVSICLTVFIVINNLAAYPHFGIFPDCFPGINHLQGKYTILLEKENMKRNHRSITVMNFVPLYISQQKMPFDRRIAPSIRETGKRSLLYFIPLFLSEFAFEKFQSLFVSQFENDRFGRGIIPDHRLSECSIGKKQDSQ